MDSQQPLAPLDKLVKPNQIQNLACLTPEEKNRYFGGISDLWSKINSNPEGHETRVMAHRNLAGVSNNLKIRMQKWKAEAQANLQTVPGPGQMPQSSGNTGPVAPSNAQAEVAQWSDAVKTQAKAWEMAYPPQLWTVSQQDRLNWANNERRKLASLLHRSETTLRALKEYEAKIKASQAQGRQFTQEERQQLQNRIHVLRQAIQEAGEPLTNWKRLQNHYKQQQEQQQQQQNMNSSSLDSARPDARPQPLPPSQVAPGTQPNNQQIKAAEQITQSSLPNPAVEAARNHTSQAERASVSPSVAVPPTQIPSSQPYNTQTPVSASSGGPMPQIPNPSAQISQPHHSPQITNSQIPNSQGPRPLTHKAAMAQARSYSQPTIPQSATSTTQGTAHAHPSMASNQQMPKENGTGTSTKWPINPNLNVTPLAPVGMGPARPTLSGGPSTGAIGPMGQPGIQKHPGFVLEGEGERVLSKKKLEELVRQVTGGSDGEGVETMDPEVEETLLDVADEFVDNVVMAACRLAKLRQSATLELRDIQLILERNYNIRVPGYASDELRTVKKIQPTQAWTQKMSAIQAARIAPGETD